MHTGDQLAELMALMTELHRAMTDVLGEHRTAPMSFRFDLSDGGAVAWGFATEVAVMPESIRSRVTEIAQAMADVFADMNDVLDAGRLDEADAPPRCGGPGALMAGRPPPRR